MKKRIPTFVAGMVTMALIGGLGVGALAASGAMTITVDPINIQVNGATFQPKDANGADVPVFAYNGTTYAPLRALAEAYGLEVGYDASTNMATVKGDTSAPTTTQTPDNTATTTDYSDWSAEEEAAYQEFKGMWEVVSDDNYTYAKYINTEPKMLVDFLTTHTEDQIQEYCKRYESGFYGENAGFIVIYMYNDSGIWTDIFGKPGIYGFTKDCINNIK